MIDSKACTKCKLVKPYNLFPYQHARKKYTTWCRSCYNESARRSRQKTAVLIRSRKHDYERKRRAERQQWVIEFLQAHPCIDCGEPDPVVLDFDHVRGKKRASVTRMLMSGYCTETLLSEISKCEVRCANCHRRKTAQTQDWNRLRLTSL
jgi:hypothetical protein